MQGMELVKEKQAVYADDVMLGYLTLARLEYSRGRDGASLATLDAFLHLADHRHFAPQVKATGQAVQAQIALLQGHLAEAMRWADECGLSPSDEDLSYFHEGEYLTLARVRIAQGRDDPAGPFLQDALRLLDRLLSDAEAKARMGSALEILMLRALALHAQNKECYKLILPARYC